ncbi:MAG: hypothetical protein IKM85_04795 [Bacteroidales bacterium]|nr:hypothetical protein [Bacteroidales bacterium]
MRDFRINWAVILALIVLLAFTYFSFMGVLYSKRVDGDLIKGCLFALGVVVIVSACVVIMCVSRATRWREIGTAGQIVFALIILTVFGFSAIPFTGFMRAIESKSLIQAKIDQTKMDAERIDSLYNAYVDDRVASYRDWLKADSSCYENAGGSTDSVKIANLMASLRNHLDPPLLKKTQDERKAWLSSIEGMSVWNIMLPKNLKVLGNAAQSWADDYVKLSNVSFDGNPPLLFSSNSFDENPLKDLGERNLRPLAVLAALLAFFFMLLPYLVTESFMGSRGSNKGNQNGKRRGTDTTVDDVDYE